MLPVLHVLCAASRHTTADAVQHAANGCLNVFLDIGANVGVHGRFLLEPNQYPKAKYKPIFDRIFGTDRNRSATCALEFEPNPAHAARHKQLESAYSNLGWRYHFFPFGVAAVAGEMVFHENPNTFNSRKMHDWAFGINNLEPNNPNNRPIRVPAVGFHDILEQVHRRKLPDGTRRQPKVVVKVRWPAAARGGGGGVAGTVGLASRAHACTPS